MNRRPSRHSQLYRFLLRFYPRSLRDEHGREMEQLFADRLREERSTRRWRGVASAWLSTLFDISKSVPHEWRLARHSTAPQRRLARPHQDSPMAGLLNELRYAGRSIRRSPGFSAMVISMLAIAIGANTAVFTLVRAVLLDPLPYPESDRMMMVWENNEREGAPRERASPTDFLDWRTAESGFETMASWREHPLILHGDQGSIQVPLARVTEEFFAVAGIEPMIGRLFSAEEAQRARYDQAERYVGGGNRVVILSHGLWERRFGADRTVLGSIIPIEGGNAEVVGVMPPGFALPSPDVEVWTPVEYRSDGQRNARFVHVFGRLRDGVSMEQAQAAMDVVARDLAARYPETNDGWGITLVAFREQLVGDVRPTLLVMLGAVGAVLLVACANVAGMQLARGSTRTGEIAVRLALGASRARLLRLFLVESLLLALAGGTLGFLMAYPGVALLRALAPVQLELVENVEISLTMLGFTLLVTVATGIAFGIAPALYASRTRHVAALARRSGRGQLGGVSRQRARRALVATEIATALVLLVTAGLLVRSFALLVNVDPGFEAKNALVLRIFLDKGRYGWLDEERYHPREYYHRLNERITDLPFVTHAGAVTALPMVPANTLDFSRPYWREDESPPVGDSRRGDVRLATPGYFRAMGMTIVQGRDFDDRDQANAPPVLIINESLADRVFPNENPVGQRLMTDYRGIRPLEIVGVVNDVRFHALRRNPRPEMYFPHAQIPYLAMTVAVRTTGDAAGQVDAIQRAALELDPLQPVHSVVRLDQIVRDTVARDRFAMALLVGLAALTLLLAATGIYGVMAFVVGQQTKEIGLRIAVGAREFDVMTMVVTESMKLALGGAALGLLGAAVLSRALGSLLFGVSPTDPVTFALVSVLIVATAAFAGLIPARRAARVDPVEALRGD